MPDAPAMIPMGISDPAFLKRKVLLAWDAGGDHRALLLLNGEFSLWVTGYCDETYYKYLVSVSKKQIDDLQWDDDTHVKTSVKGKKLIVEKDNSKQKWK